MPTLAVVIVAVLLALSPGRWGLSAAAAEPAPPAKNLFAPPAGDRVPAPTTASPAPSPVGQVTAFIHAQQRALYRQLAGAVRAVQFEGTMATAASLVMLSFLYGVFHAAGPGHGKAVISAYLLANERAVKRGIGLSFAASLTQAASAIVLVSAVVFALQGLGVTTRQSLVPMSVISAALIVAIGAWMLWSSVRGLRSHDTGAADAGSGHAEGAAAASAAGCGGRFAACGHAHDVHPQRLDEPLRWGKAGAIVAAIGVRPCSGAIFVLLFANSIGFYVAGVWSTLAMALGTAITVSLLAVLTLVSKKAALRLAGDHGRWLGRIHGSLGVLGSLLVLGLGILLLLAASDPQTPLPMG
ncbi:MAG: nickel/cobalt transporter [Rhodospirillales bacterium]